MYAIVFEGWKILSAIRNRSLKREYTRGYERGAKCHRNKYVKLRICLEQNLWVS